MFTLHKSMATSKYQISSLLFLLVVLGIIPALGIAKSPELVTVIGKIESINHQNKTLIVDGVRMVADTNTQIHDSKNNMVLFSELRAGHSVESRYWHGSGVDFYTIDHITLLSRYSSHKIPAL